MRSRSAACSPRRLREGAQPNEIGVFVRCETELARARAAVEAGGATAAELGGDGEPVSERIAIGTMHLAKGLEFRVVAVMACDEDILPSPSRIENVADEADLEDAYDTERHLLYVACTRARDHLLATGVEPLSEFLGDFSRPQGSGNGVTAGMPRSLHHIRAIILYRAHNHRI